MHDLDLQGGNWKSAGQGRLSSAHIGVLTFASAKTQTTALTASYDVGTALAVGLTGGAILATPAGGALLKFKV